MKFMVIQRFFKQEVVLTHPVDRNSMQCLDYMFEVKVKARNENSDYRVDLDSVSVEDFVVDHSKVTQLSDHYGLSAVLKATSQ